MKKTIKLFNIVVSAAFYGVLSINLISALWAQDYQSATLSAALLAVGASLENLIIANDIKKELYLVPFKNLISTQAVLTFKDLEGTKTKTKTKKPVDKKTKATKAE